MRRIMLIGSGGSGKSTLARKLGDRLALPVHHLDMLMWRPGWELLPRSEQTAVQSRLIDEKQWIIDGNYSGSMDMRIAAADTVILLDINRVICVYRALKRTWTYRNTSRPDMNPGCEERFDLHFLKWIWDYKKRNLPAVLEMLGQLPADKRVIILRSAKEVDSFLEDVEKRAAG